MAWSGLKLVTSWVNKSSADVSAVHGPFGSPTLAFAIMIVNMAKSKRRQGKNGLVAHLLGLWAPPSSIPSGYYSPYWQDLPLDGPKAAMGQNMLLKSNGALGQLPEIGLPNKLT